MAVAAVTAEANIPATVPRGVPSQPVPPPASSCSPRSDAIVGGVPDAVAGKYRCHRHRRHPRRRRGATYSDWANPHRRFETLTAGFLAGAARAEAAEAFAADDTAAAVAATASAATAAAVALRKENGWRGNWPHPLFPPGRFAYC